LLRSFLELEHQLPPVSYPGNHYLAYFELGPEDFQRNRLLLSQPFGDDGIWVVERSQQMHGIVNHATPQSDTLSMTEYFAGQQALFERGDAPWLIDPYAVAMAYLELNGWHDREITEFYHVAAGTSDPLYLQGLSAPMNEYGITMQERHAGALAGPIAIIGNTLYLDQVEVIFSTDSERIAVLWPDFEGSVYDLMPTGFFVRDLNVEIIWPDDHERIEELGLDIETDFPSDWWEPYERLLGTETLSFEITDATVFEFVDYSLSLGDTNPDGNRQRTTSLDDFLTARPGVADASWIGASTFRRTAMFVQVNSSGQVVSVTEELSLAQ